MKKLLKLNDIFEIGSAVSMNLGIVDETKRGIVTAIILRKDSVKYEISRYDGEGSYVVEEYDAFLVEDAT